MTKKQVFRSKYLLVQTVQDLNKHIHILVIMLAVTYVSSFVAFRSLSHTKQQNEIL